MLIYLSINTLLYAFILIYEYFISMLIKYLLPRYYTFVFIHLLCRENMSPIL